MERPSGSQTASRPAAPVSVRATADDDLVDVVGEGQDRCERSGVPLGRIHGPVLGDGAHEQGQRHGEGDHHQRAGGQDDEQEPTPHGWSGAS